MTLISLGKRLDRLETPFPVPRGLAERLEEARKRCGIEPRPFIPFKSRTLAGRLAEAQARRLERAAND